MSPACASKATWGQYTVALITAAFSKVEIPAHTRNVEEGQRAVEYSWSQFPTRQWTRNREKSYVFSYVLKKTLKWHLLYHKHQEAAGAVVAAVEVEA